MPGTRTEPAAADAALVERLRGGDEQSFCALARAQHPALQRVAMLYVPEPATASAAVCDGWKGALAALDRWQQSASLRSFVARHVVIAARGQAERDGRFVPFSALRDPGLVPEPSVDAARFRDGDDPNYPGGWRAFPADWTAFDQARACAVLARAIDRLPPAQRALVALRDVHGWTTVEVASALDVDEPAQRIHLHRARSKLRYVLDELMRSEQEGAA